MSEAQYIQWFPGHMTKTRRQMQKDIALVDAVAEIIDARIPRSSRNPDLLEVVGNKPVVVLLNKCDMADIKVSEDWISYFKSKGIAAIAVDCKSGKGLNEFRNCVVSALSDKIEANRQKGMVGRKIRVMVAGIPNVGKSTFINRMAGRNKAVAENRPGVTKGNQWFTVDKQLEILDTPGVLWPKFANRTIGEHLAFTGAVKDKVLDTEYLAVRLLELLSATYSSMLDNRYGPLNYDGDGYSLLCQIAEKRGMMIKGGEYDTLRAADMLLQEFRNCKLGRITLERVDENA